MGFRDTYEHGRGYVRERLPSADYHDYLPRRSYRARVFDRLPGRGRRGYLDDVEDYLPSRNTSLVLGLAALALGAALGVYLLGRRRRQAHPPDDAPGRTSRHVRYGDYAVSGRTVTIAKPRAELYAFWRDFNNLPQFMDNVEAVMVEGDVSVWKIKAPAGRSVTVRTRIVQDRENELIAWRSTEDSDIETEGRVTFRDAPGGRGTQVEAIVAYVPPAGQLGRWIAMLFQREPSVQGRRDLKRLKMLMETGEIATNANRRAAA